MVSATFLPDFLMTVVTPAFTPFFVAGVTLALLSAAINGSFHILIWPAKIFATVSLPRRTVEPAGVTPSSL